MARSMRSNNPVIMVMLNNKNKLEMKSISIFAAFMLLFIAGCKKDGPPGKDGKDGNANVKSSTVTFSTWTWDSSTNYEYSDFTWSAITSSIVNDGAVLIYLSTANGWVPLPRTIYPTTSYSESQRFLYNLGTFKIIVQDSDLLPPSPALTTWTIRVLAIESSGLKTHPNTNWGSYEEVKHTFNLKD